MSFSSRLLSASLVLASSLALAGCIVDLDAGGNGGTGGSGGAGGNGGQGGSGGQPGCKSHSDCPVDLICVFSTGECRPPCFDDTQCGAAEECRECVTSACPQCEDCRGACYPKQAAGCDEHADCPGGLCIFSTGQCASECSGPEGCSAPGEVCDGCATSACPECDDCRAACVPGNGKCDTADDCASGEACNWLESTCRTVCSDAGFACEAGFACAECATGSCPGCADCVDLCLPE